MEDDIFMRLNDLVLLQFVASENVLLKKVSCKTRPLVFGKIPHTTVRSISLIYFREAILNLPQKYHDV